MARQFLCLLLIAIAACPARAIEEIDPQIERAQNMAANALTAEETAEGWRALFDGETASGLRGLKHRDFLKAGWTIANGALVLAKEVNKMGEITGGDLITAEQFTDFEFAFQWKLGVSSNSGILYLARSGLSGTKPTGCEYQIIDDVHHPDGLKAGPIRRTGALFDILPPAETKVLHEPGRWNAGKIRVQGNHVEHWLNGAKVVEYDLATRAFQQAIAASQTKWPYGFGMVKFKTALVILDEGDEITLRALKIRPLPPAAAPAYSTPTR
jgi:hypothetical protein